MKNIKDWFRIHGISVVIIILLLALNTNSRINESKVKVDLTELSQEFDNYKLKDGTLVASSGVAKVEVSRLKETIKKSSTSTKLLAKKFHKINSLGVTNTSVVIDTVKVAYNDTIRGTKPFVQEGSFKDIGYSFNYRSTEKGFTLSDVVMKDTVTRVTGVKRKWLLGRETYTIDEIHSNPHIVVTGAQNFEVKPTYHWYTSKPFIFVVGVAAGTYLAKKL